MPRHLFSFAASVRKRPGRRSGVVTIPSWIMNEFKIRRGDQWRCAVDPDKGIMVFALTDDAIPSMRSFR